MSWNKKGTTFRAMKRPRALSIITQPKTVPRPPVQDPPTTMEQASVNLPMPESRPPTHDEDKEEPAVDPKGTNKHPMAQLLVPEAVLKVALTLAYPWKMWQFMEHVPRSVAKGVENNTLSLYTSTFKIKPTSLCILVGSVQSDLQPRLESLLLKLCY